MNIVSSFGLVEIAFQFAWLFLVQSTALIVGVFAIVWIFRVRNAALLSAVYHCTLLAVLAAPLITLTTTRWEVSGWWPSGWTESSMAQVGDITTTSNEPVSLPDLSVAANELQPARSPEPDFGTFEPKELVDSKSEAAFVTTAPQVASKQSGQVRSFRQWRTAKAWLCGGWFVVSALLLIRQWRARRTLWRTLRAAVPAPPVVIAICDRLAAELDVKPPRVVGSPYFTSPFLAGVVDPVVHLSSDSDGDVIDGNETALREVLIHELAHLKRHDVAMRTINQSVVAILFFQPLLWRLVVRIENSAEDVCDDYAVSLGTKRDRYAERLVDLAASCDSPLGAIGIASGKSMLKHRVSRIMDGSRALSMHVSRRLMILTGLATTLTVMCVGMMLTPAVGATAQTPSGSPEAAPVLAEPERVRDGNRDDEPSRSDDVVRGMILGESGPLGGAEVFWWRSRVFDMDSMAPVRVVTDESGEFELQRTSPNPDDPAIWDMREEMLIRAEGYGFVRTGPRQFGATIPPDPDLPVGYANAGEPLQLAAKGTPIRGRLIDNEGQAIAGAKVRIRWFSQLRGVNLAAELPPEQTEKERIRQVASLVNVIEHVPLRDALPMATTNDEGRFTLTGLPGESLFELLVERNGIQSTDLVVRNYDGDRIVTVPQAKGFELNGPTKVYPAEFQTVIEPSIPVVGTITDAETGVPIAGAVVRTIAVHGKRITSSRERQHLATRTNAVGRFQINGLPIGDGNRLVVFTTGDVAYMPVRGSVDTSDAQAISDGRLNLDFQVKRGLWAEGRVYEADTHEPFQGEVSYYWFRNRELESTYPGSLFAYLDGRYFTDSDGRYRVPVLPTPGVIAFSTGNRNLDRMAVYPRGSGENELTGYRKPEGSYPWYDTVPTGLMPGDYNRLALVEPKPDQKVVTVDLPLVAAHPIPVTILDPDGTHANREMELFGGNERFGWQEKSSAGFVVEDVLPAERRKVFAFDRKRNLVGGVLVDHEDGKKFEMRLAPAGSVRGRLIDGDGEPITDATLSIEYGDFLDDETTATWARQVGKHYMPSEVTLKEQGRFELLGLSSKWKYSARASHRRKGRGRIFGYPFRDLVIQPGEDRDLGDVVIKKD